MITAAREARPGSDAVTANVRSEPTARAAGPSIPGQPEIMAAWHSLPPETRDRIGIAVVDMAFQGFVSGAAHAPEDRPVPGADAAAQAIRDVADTACNDRLTELHREIEGLFPDLFGPPGANPEWAAAMGARR